MIKIVNKQRPGLPCDMDTLLGSPPYLWLVLINLIVSGLFTPLQAEDSLTWNVSDKKISADIRSWSIRAVLESLSTQTAWEIYLEPGIEQRINTRFTDLSYGDALERLLDPLSYVVVPTQGSATRLFVYQTSVSGATERIQGVQATQDESEEEKADKAYKNEVIVTLDKDGELSAEELAKRFGARVMGQLEDLNAYRLAFDDPESAAAALDSIRDESGVTSAETNMGYSRPPSPQFLSSAGPVHPLLKPQTPQEGSSLIIGLIDTAITHPNPLVAPFLLEQKSIFPDMTYNDQEFSHGMAMAETMLKGIEMVRNEGSTTRILPVDIYGNNENTSTFDVAMGINLAIKEGATLVNLSLGSSEQSQFIEELIQNYKNQGVMFVAAAGNQPVTTPTYPAAYSPVMAVTAGTHQGELAPYANRGEFIDVIAPGASIVHDQNARSFLGTGTSFSSAYVSGVAAGLSEQGQSTMIEVEKQVLESLKYRPSP